MAGRRRRRGAIITVAAVVLVVGGLAALFQLGGPALLPNTCEIAGTGDATVSLSAEQAQIATVIGAVSAERRLPTRAAVIATATAMQESKLRNLDHGDRDSLGVFQQRPSQGWGTPEQVADPLYATRAFYDRLVEVPGYLDRPLTQVAQDVQRSGYPEAYAQHEDVARTIAEAFVGAAPRAVACRLDAPSRSTATSALTADIGDQFGVRPRADGDTVMVGTDTSRGAAAIAAWSVANAARHGITSVSHGGFTWTRGDTAAALNWKEDPNGGSTSTRTIIRTG